MHLIYWIRPPNVMQYRPFTTAGSWRIWLLKVGVVQYPAQLGLQHLAVIVLGQRLREAIIAGALEAGDVVEAQPVERLARDFCTRPRYDKGDDFLAPFGVWTPDDRSLGNVGVAQQDLLDLARIDVAAAADDHVLGAVTQGQKPVFVEAAEIAGVQPAAAQRLGAGLGLLPIALHDAVALRGDFADLAGRQFTIAIVDDF